MKTVQLQFQGEATGYEVVIRRGGVEALGEIIEDLTGKRVVVLADAHVYSLYGSSISASLEASGFRVIHSTFDASESSKSLETVQRFYDFLISNRIERNTPILALGGGIAGDVVGFVAASYLRGLPFIQIPTTLLAMVDASVGGKVGVNLPQGKNLVGAFHQPRAVVIDPLVLNTLSEREFRAGLSECIKHAVITDADLFDWTENHVSRILARDPSTLEELISRNVAIKAKIVMADEKEQGERALLNLGHTFAHAIESATKYTAYLHGEAVALGLVAAADLAIRTCRDDSARPAYERAKQRIETLVSAVGLPIRMPISENASEAAENSAPSLDSLLAVMLLDKKVEQGNIRFILPRGIGSAEIRKDISASTVSDAWNSIRA